VQELEWGDVVEKIPEAGMRRRFNIRIYLSEFESVMATSTEFILMGPRDVVGPKLRWSSH